MCGQAYDVLTGMDEARFTTRLARDMGFGDHAQELFAELAMGRNGSADSSVLSDKPPMLKKDLQCMREFLSAMRWNTTEVKERRQRARCADLFLRRLLIATDGLSSPLLG